MSGRLCFFPRTCHMHVVFVSFVWGWALALDAVTQTLYGRSQSLQFSVCSLSWSGVSQSVNDTLCCIVLAYHLPAGIVIDNKSVSWGRYIRCEELARRLKWYSSGFAVWQLLNYFLWRIYWGPIMLFSSLLMCVYQLLGEHTTVMHQGERIWLFENHS